MSPAPGQTGHPARGWCTGRRPRRITSTFPLTHSPVQQACWADGRAQRGCGRGAPAGGAGHWPAPRGGRRRAAGAPGGARPRRRSPATRTARNSSTSSSSSRWRPARGPASRWTSWRASCAEARAAAAEAAGRVGVQVAALGTSPVSVEPETATTAPLPADGRGLRADRAGAAHLRLPRARPDRLGRGGRGRAGPYPALAGRAAGAERQLPVLAGAGQFLRELPVPGLGSLAVLGTHRVVRLGAGLPGHGGSRWWPPGRCWTAAWCTSTRGSPSITPRSRCGSPMSACGTRTRC